MLTCIVLCGTSHLSESVSWAQCAGFLGVFHTLDSAQVGCWMYRQLPWVLWATLEWWAVSGTSGESSAARHVHGAETPLASGLMILWLCDKDRSVVQSITLGPSSGFPFWLFTLGSHEFGPFISVPSLSEEREYYPNLWEQLRWRKNEVLLFFLNRKLTGVFCASGK